jgi:aminoglycoside phosphotransferase family enzyme/predicted kinase
MQQNTQLQALQSIPPIDFSAMLNALAQPGAFPYPIAADKQVTVIQTHASAVLLIPAFAYKLKKSKNFGFFDYSTPTLRRHFCIQEVLLNRRLAPHIYLGVAPVLLSSAGRFRFGKIFSPAEVPQPGTQLENCLVVDYAVVMQRLPDEATLESLVRAGRADADLLAEIARYVAAFHRATPSNEHIASFGTLAIIRKNWEENFEQLQPYIGRTLDPGTYERLVAYIRDFLEARKALFESRVRDGHIRDCHGDLRLQHIYLLNIEAADPQSTYSIAILDGIEFNERFRYGDVAAEVAFLTMELDAAGRKDLSAAFVAAYLQASGDEELRELLPFYACYRACVRGKVMSFQLDEPELLPAQREQARAQARALLLLAASYISGPTQPTLLLFGGLMGTGKSTLARALQRESGWALFSSDEVRKELAQVSPLEPQVAEFGQGLYSPEWTTQTYHALISKAHKTLQDGRSVILDATFLHRADRQAAAQQAADTGGTCIFVECVCPPEITLARLERRWQARLLGKPETASSSSDARPDLYTAQSARWEEFLPGKEIACRHFVVDTSQPLASSIEQVHQALFGELRVSL